MAIPLNPASVATFDAALSADFAPDIDNSSSVPNNEDEVESHSADAGPDEEAEDTDESSPAEAGELDEDDAPAAPGEPVDADEERFADKRQAVKAWKEAERELGRKANELAQKQSRLLQMEAQLADTNRQLQAARLPADTSQLTPEQYDALAAEAQRQGFDNPEDYVSDRRLEQKLESKLGTIYRNLAYEQAKAYSGTLPDMDKVGPRVVAILEESGAIEGIPSYLDAHAQALQMQQAIKTAHLQAHNEYLQEQIPKIRRAEAQRAKREAEARRAGKQSSTVAGAKGAVPSPGAASQRDPAAGLISQSKRWYDSL